MSRLLLVGMMGAGKSTVARILAERLGWPWSDSDDEVAARTGRTVPEIFAAEGEVAFRELEADVLRIALARPGPAVVAVAGGAVLDPATRELLRGAGTVVWLRARPDTLAHRVGDGEGRPLLNGDAAAALARLDAERQPVYAGVAQVVVEVDGLDPEDVADRVLEAAGLATGGAAGGDARGDAGGAAR